MAKRKSEGLAVSWKAAGEYSVHVLEDAFVAGAEALLAALREASGSENPRVFVVADSNVVQRTEALGSKMGRFLQERGLEIAARPVMLAGGEKIKSDRFASTTLVMNALLEAKVGAHDVLLALGGGSLLDVAGYAAAQVRGGVPLVRMPTTVAAMVDAAWSDWAAVDGDSVKDAFRVLARPAAIVLDVTFASTVLDGVWRAGFAEAVRLAAVGDAALFKKLVKLAEPFRGRDPEALREVVTECARVRAKKGGSDFALWSAARLEAMSGYKLPHGHAVSVAICIDCAYAVARGLLSEADQEAICETLTACGALDGIAHNRHLVSQVDSLLLGLDARRLMTGSEALTLPGALGKAVTDEQPDRETYRAVIRSFLEAMSTSD